MRDAIVKGILIVLYFGPTAGCVFDEVVEVDPTFNGASESLPCECMIETCSDTCRFYVDGAISVSGDGRSWETAVKKIQTGVNYAYCAVTSCAEINECDVWVAGRHTHDGEEPAGPPIDYSYDNEAGTYNDTLRLRKHVNLYGGFDRTESSPEERSFLSEKNNDGLSAAAVQKLSWLVYPGHKITRVILADGNAVIDGFSISGGTLDAANEPWIGPIEGGAGILVQGIEMVIANCAFEGNGGQGIFGGAVFVEGGEATIVDSLFERNSAHAGGAVAVSSGSLDLFSCVLGRNTASLGGAVYGDDAKSITISRSTLNDNFASDLGGAVFTERFRTPDAQYDGLAQEDSLLVLESSFFYRNSAHHGGAVLGNSYEGARTPAVIANCTFLDNVDSNGYPSIEHSEAEVVNSIIWGDVAPESGIAHAKSISHSIVKGGNPGVGIVDEDPRIELVATGEAYDTSRVTYELAEGSPCIDAANADAGPDLDMYGYERVDDPDVENTGTGYVDYMDIGAVERHP